MIDKYGTKWIEIDLENLAGNIRLIKQRINNASIIGVVKADAYGHGAPEVASVLAANGVNLFAVSCIEEAIELRRAFLNREILLMGASPISQIADIINYQITPTICTVEFATALNKEAVKRKKTIGVHIEVDTGMGRVGPRHDIAVKFIKKISKLKNLRLAGLYSHFATADENDLSFAFIQQERFSLLVAKLGKEKLLDSVLVHMSNSGGVLNLPSAAFNAVRPGLILYGIYPCAPQKNYPTLRSVFSLKCRVVFVKTVEAGFTVGYGQKYVAKRTTDIITLPLGYADGFRRQFTNRGTVLIKGKRFPVVGSVCMDMIMVDCGKNSGIKCGDEAVIIGSQGREIISVYDIARDLGTIPYEVICTMGRRLTRVYKKGTKTVFIKKMISEY